MGKAFAEKTQSKVIRENQKNIDDLFALINSRGQPPTLSIPPFGGVAAPGFAKFLRTDGGAMFGPIAYNNALVSVSSGRLDIRGKTDDDLAERDDTSYVLVTGQGTPDDLNFIDGAQFEGQILVLQGTASQVLNVIHAQLPNISNIVGDGATNIVTVTTSVDHNLLTGAIVNILTTTNFNTSEKSITVTSPTIFTYDLGDTGSATPETSGTVQDGNIVTGDGTTLVMDSTVATNALAVAIFIFDTIIPGDGGWRFIGGAGISGGGGAGGIFDPIITKDNGNIASAGPGANLDWSLEGGNFHRHTVSGDVAFTMLNLPGTEKYEQMVLQITQDGTGGHDVTFSDSFHNSHTPVVAQGPNDITTLVFYSYFDGPDRILGFNTTQIQSFKFAMSDEKTPLDTPSGIDPFTTFRMGNAMTLTEVRAELRIAGSGSVVTIDIKESGSSVLSTLLTIDAGDSTSVGASVPAEISDSVLADNAPMELFLTTRDSGNTATGLKVTLIGYIT